MKALALALVFQATTNALAADIPYTYSIQTRHRSSSTSLPQQEHPLQEQFGGVSASSSVAPIDGGDSPGFHPSSGSLPYSPTASRPPDSPLLISPMNPPRITRRAPPNTCTSPEDCSSPLSARDDGDSSDDDGDHFPPTTPGYPIITSVFNTTPYPSIPATTTIPGVVLTTITSTAFSTFYKDKEHTDEVYPYTTLTITTVGVNLASSSSSPSTVPAQASVSEKPALRIALAAVGLVLAVLLGAAFVLFLRKGTFGSGVLCGLRYGDARYDDWPGHGYVREGGATEMRARGKGSGTGGAGEQDGDPYGSTTTLPAIPRHLKPPSSSSSSTRTRTRARPPRAGAASPSPSSATTVFGRAPSKRAATPGAWSTSPSAFDNVYGGAGSSVGAPSERSASPPVSEIATLVSASASMSTSDAGRRSVSSQQSQLAVTHTPVPRRALSPLSEDTTQDPFEGDESARSDSTLGHVLPPSHPYLARHHKPAEGSSVSSADAEETDPFRGGGSRSASPAPTQSSGSVFTHGVRISSWHSGDSDSELELSLSRGQYGGPG